jgi:hypothetical protein
MPCVRRLQELLSGQRGIGETHVVEEGGRSVLCLHYGADMISLEEVERRARAAGAEVLANRHDQLEDPGGVRIGADALERRSARCSCPWTRGGCRRLTIE